MIDGSPLEDAIRDHIQSIRGVPVKWRQKESAFGPMVTDWMFRDEREDMHFVEVVGGVPTLRNLATLSLLRDYHEEHYKTAWGTGSPGFWLASKTFPSVVKQVAKDIKIELIPIPSGVPVVAGSRLPGRSGVTAPKAWRVLFHLLLEPASSMNALSRKTGVSYAWTHRLVNTLLDQQVLRKERGFIEVDESRLLDFVAWERPLGNLRVKKFRSDQDDEWFLARSIADDMGKTSEFAFTGPAASSWRTKVQKTGGRLDVYLPEPDRIDEMLGPGEGVVVHVYKMDRSLRTQEISGVTVVDDPNLVLDLAGLGTTYHDHVRSVLEYARSESRRP